MPYNRPTTERERENEMQENKNTLEQEFDRGRKIGHEEGYKLAQKLASPLLERAWEAVGVARQETEEAVTTARREAIEEAKDEIRWWATEQQLDESAVKVLLAKVWSILP